VVPEISSISVSFSGSRQDLIDALLEELAEPPIIGVLSVWFSSERSASQR
jgi:hypothetical protein